MIKCKQCMYQRLFFGFAAGEPVYYCNNKYGVTATGISTYLSQCGEDRELSGCNCGTLREEFRYKGGDNLQLSLGEK